MRVVITLCLATLLSAATSGPVRAEDPVAVPDPGPAGDEGSPLGILPISGPIVLLPVQDRAGDPEAAAAVESALIRELGDRYPIIEPARIRDDLRRARVRDSGELPARGVRRMAEATGAGNFFSATLHQAVRGDVPQIMIAARLFGTERPELIWAGFTGLSGADGVRWLDRGRIVDLEELAAVAVRRLVRDLESPAPGYRHASRPLDGAFSIENRSITEIGRIAVVPFDVAGGMPGAGEILTDIALAVLHRRGARLALPGNVVDLLKQRGVLLRGEIDGLVRAALRAGSGADALFTGTVEMLQVRPRGTEPEPRAALSARLVDAGTGRILWMAGAERSGWDHEGFFQWSRVHSLGALSEGIMESLIASLEGSGGRRPRRTEQ